MSELNGLSAFADEVRPVLGAFGRVGEPEDIGEAIRAIVSPSAGWITAQRIETSGGQGL